MSMLTATYLVRRMVKRSLDNSDNPKGVLLMTAKNQLENLSMKGAAFYRIRVRGELDPKMSDRFEGMEIENTFRKDGRAESVLEGRLGDQSALSGVLNTLYELHLPVVSADCLGAADDDNEDK